MTTTGVHDSRIPVGEPPAVKVVFRVFASLQRFTPSGMMRKCLVCFVWSLVPSTAFQPTPRARSAAIGSRNGHVHVLTAVKRDTVVLPDLSQVCIGAGRLVHYGRDVGVYVCGRLWCGAALYTSQRRVMVHVSAAVACVRIQQQLFLFQTLDSCVRGERAGVPCYRLEDAYPPLQQPRMM